jgi:hypothetical protein
MNVNRLSGDIPSSLDGIDNVDVVAGNLFDCEDLEDLPSKDANSESYVCGSSDYDVSLTVWCAVLAVYASVASALVYMAYRIAASGSHTTDASKEGDVDRCTALTFWWARQIASFKCRVEAKARLVRSWREQALTVDAAEFREIARYVNVLTFIRRSTLQLTAMIVPTTFVFYFVSKIHGDMGTHSYQYRWHFTAAFLSGTLPSVIVMLIFVLSILFLVRRIVHAEARLTEIGNASTSGEAEVEVGGISRNDVVLRTGKDKDDKNRDNVRKSYSLVLVCLTCNGLIVLFIKGVYVYASLKDNIPSRAKLLLKLLLSVFDIFWNSVVLSKVVTTYGHFMRAKVRIRLHLSLILFNSIIAPVIASAMTDENCFVELFQGVEKVTSSSTLAYCARLDPTDFTNNPPNCLDYGTLSVSTEYTPPFLYSYQCTSSIFANFIPVFMFSYTVLAFVVPLFLATVAYSASNTEVFTSFLHLLPSILWPTRPNAADSDKIIAAEIVMSCLLQHVVVLITYGLVAPTLALAVCCTVVITSYQWQILIGRYLACQGQHRASSESPQCAEVSTMTTGKRGVINSVQTVHCVNLDVECRGVWLGPLQSVWTIVDLSCLFFAVVFIDMAGDEIGWRKALLCISLPTMAIPIILRVVYRDYAQNFFHCVQNKLSTKPSIGVVEDVASPMTSYPGNDDDFGGL